MTFTAEKLIEEARRLPSTQRPIFGHLFRHNADLVRKFLNARSPDEALSQFDEYRRIKLVAYISALLGAYDVLKEEFGIPDRLHMPWLAVKEGMMSLSRTVSELQLTAVDEAFQGIKPALQALADHPDEFLLGHVGGYVRAIGAETTDSGDDISLAFTAYNDLQAYTSGSFEPPAVPPLTLNLPKRLAPVRLITPVLMKAGKRAKQSYVTVFFPLFTLVEITQKALKAPLSSILQQQGVSEAQAQFLDLQYKEWQLMRSVLCTTNVLNEGLPELLDSDACEFIEDDVRFLFGRHTAGTPLYDALQALVETNAALLHVKPCDLPAAIRSSNLTGNIGTRATVSAAIVAVRVL